MQIYAQAGKLLVKLVLRHRDPEYKGNTIRVVNTNTGDQTLLTELFVIDWMRPVQNFSPLQISHGSVSSIFYQVSIGQQKRNLYFHTRKVNKYNYPMSQNLFQVPLFALFILPKPSMSNLDETASNWAQSCGGCFQSKRK